MDLSFGQTQPLMSRRMKAYPLVAKWVYRIFGYTQIGNYARAGVFKSLLKELPLERIETVLDLGCGQGEYAFSMARAFPNKSITALDIEPERVAKIQTIATTKGWSNLKTFLGPVEQIDPKEQQYDLIYSIDVFEHILEEKMPFEAAYQCLREDGFLIIKMPSKLQRTIFPDRLFTKHQSWLEQEHIGQVYELKDLVSRMERAGFKIHTARYADGSLSRLAWECSYLARKVSPVLQLLLLPINKLLVRLDQSISRKKKGNTIQVIGQKKLKNYK